jgi:hypothetical protein
MSIRNNLLVDIVDASGGIVRNHNNRNMLLEDWWFNVGGSYGFPDIYPRYFNTLDPVLASYYQLATPWVATGDLR